MKKNISKIFPNKAVAAFWKSTVGTLCIIVTSLFILSAGCADNEKENEDENEIVSLTGTKWELAGIVDVQTGELKELEPKDCDYCYTLEFDSDSTATGFSAGNKIKVCLLQSCISTGAPAIIGLMTFVHDGEIGDARLFNDAIYIVDSYSVEKNGMKFFYNNKRNYLLFKLVES
jgi:hypothetical protein